MQRTFVADLGSKIGEGVALRGWVHRYRETLSTVFIVLQDASGTTQIVAGHEAVKDAALKTEDCIEVQGTVRAEQRAKQGFEVDLVAVRVLARAGSNLPFTSGSDLDTVGQEVVLDYRPMSLRTDRGGTIFRVQA